MEGDEGEELDVFRHAWRIMDEKVEEEKMGGNVKNTMRGTSTK